MPTATQEGNFAAMIEGDDLIKVEITVHSSALDDAIDWINKNLDPDEVFSENKLFAWAESNGYTKIDQ